MVVVVVVVAAGSNTLFLNLQLFDPWKLEVLHRLICRQLLPIEQSGRLANVMDKKLTAGKKKEQFDYTQPRFWKSGNVPCENQRTREPGRVPWLRVHPTPQSIPSVDDSTRPHP